MFSEVRFQVASSLPTSIHQVSIEQRARLSPAKLIDDSPNAALPTKVRQKPVWLQNACAAGPPGDIGSQKRREVVRAWRQLLSSKTDSAKIQVHNRIDQPA